MPYSTLQFQISPKIEGVWTHACYDAPPDIDDAGNVQNDFDERATNSEGYVAYGFVDRRMVYVLIRAQGYEDVVLGPIAMPHDDLIAVTLTPLSAPVARLHGDGPQFKTDSGKSVFLKGSTFFAGYWLFLEHGPQAIEPALQQLQSLGCNMIRVFGMSFYVQQNLFGSGPFNPASYGNDYFDKLPAFCALAAQHGMYVYFSAFPDNDLIPPYHNNQGVQVNHWNRLLDALKDVPNVLLEVSNEPDAHGFNYINPQLLTFPSFCPACPGSYGEDSDAYASGAYPSGADWGNSRSFGDLHPRRSYPAEVMDSMAVNNVYYLHNRPLMIGEPDRFGSGGNGNVEQARLTGAAGACGAVGIVFHSLQGEKCEVFDSNTFSCAQAFFNALKGIS